ncbi:MAG: NAD(P)H-dependent oxidoreductase subunit E [Deltaproteobacteria bacterium]|nr:NAD(P)H-dependent oxidoreductase subunit E [Deltaproteobacteria bacterium]
MNEAEKLVKINPDLTHEVMSRVDEIIARFKGKDGGLIPVLEECQGIVGYLPVELQEYIGKGLNLPGSTVYGVVTFYSFFTMVPKGRHNIKVCLGTACYVRGTKNIVKKLKDDIKIGIGETTEDRRFSLQAVRCLGACGLAPAVVVDEDTYGGVKPNMVSDILAKYE